MMADEYEVAELRLIDEVRVGLFSTPRKVAVPERAPAHKALSSSDQAKRHPRGSRGSWTTCVQHNVAVRRRGCFTASRSRCSLILPPRRGSRRGKSPAPEFCCKPSRGGFFIRSPEDSAGPSGETHRRNHPGRRDERMARRRQAERPLSRVSIAHSRAHRVTTDRAWATSTGSPAPEWAVSAGEPRWLPHGRGSAAGRSLWASSPPGPASPDPSPGGRPPIAGAPAGPHRGPRPIPRGRARGSLP